MNVMMLAALLAGADPEPVTPPKGPPPMISHLKNDGGRVVRLAVEQIPLTYMEKVEVVEGGRKVVKDVFRTKIVLVSKLVIVSTGKESFSTAGGKKLDEVEAMKRLRAGAIAAVSADGKPVDKTYLRALKPDTLVLVPAPTPAADAGKKE